MDRRRTSKNRAGSQPEFDERRSLAYVNRIYGGLFILGGRGSFHGDNVHQAHKNNRGGIIFQTGALQKKFAVRYFFC